MKLTKEQAHRSNYDDYAFHVAKLRQFYTYQEEDGSNAKSKATAPKPDMDNSMSRKLQISMDSRKQLDASVHSIEEAAPARNHNSVHGNNVWDTIKKQLSANQNPSTLKKVNSTSALNKMF